MTDRDGHPIAVLYDQYRLPPHRGQDLGGHEGRHHRHRRPPVIHVVHRGDPAAQQRDRENSLADKLREAKIAVRIDRTMTKDRISPGT